MNYSTSNIRFGYEKTLRKWKFQSEDGSFTLATAVKNGRDGAEKIARQIKGGLARTKNNGLDELARVTIRKFENYV